MGAAWVRKKGTPHCAAWGHADRNIRALSQVSSEAFPARPMRRLPQVMGTVEGATDGCRPPRASSPRGDPVSTSSPDPDLGEVFGPSPDTASTDLVQLLTPEGERVEHPDFSSTLDDEAIKGLYRDMVLTRRIDVEATALQRHGELGIWAQLLGQEAAQIGSGRALRTQDYVFPTYREHGV